MRSLRLDVGTTIMVNLTTGDAVKGTISLHNAGAVFLKSATLHSAQGASPLDGEIRIPMSTVAWIQVL